MREKKDRERRTHIAAAYMPFNHTKESIVPPLGIFVKYLVQVLP